MKPLSINSKIIILIGFMSICCTPLFAIAYPIPPPIEDIYPSSYNVIDGDLVDGDLGSVYLISDGDIFKVRCDWSWFLEYYFYATVKFDFPNTKCDRLKVHISDNIGQWPETYMTVIVYYTSGSPKYFNDKKDGYYNFNIDETRYLDYVKIELDYHSILGGDKYLKVDLCIGTP